MPDKTSKHYNMSFSQQLIKEPLLYNLGLKFGIEFNISQANVTEALGNLTVSFHGSEEKLEDALKYLKDRGVEIEEIPAPISA